MANIILYCKNIRFILFISFIIWAFIFNNHKDNWSRNTNTTSCNNAKTENIYSTLNNLTISLNKISEESTDNIILNKPYCYKENIYISDDIIANTVNIEYRFQKNRLSNKPPPNSKLGLT
jgi:hypothetical protein